MGEHRDDSKAAAAEGGWQPDPRDERGRTRAARSEDDYSAEERTFSQSGGSGSQPGMGKRLATRDYEDQGHFDRGHMGKQSAGDESKRNRAEGALKHGARPK